MSQISHILTHQLFIRSHYSEASNTQVKSSYSEKVMADIMEDVMKRYDNDTNATIDYDEFKGIISDADVDLMFCLY